MDPLQQLHPARGPRYPDFLKAAFNLRVNVPRLGGLPLNWLYLAAVAGIGFAAWPTLLVGGAIEIAYLTAMAGNPRFQRIVRSMRRAQREENTEAALRALVDSLSEGRRASYEAFHRKCDDVLSIARRLGQTGEAALETYDSHLAELREVYARMLVLIDTFAKYSQDRKQSDPRHQIAAIEKELEEKELSDSVRTSREATRAILERRAQSRKDIAERGRVIESELGRLEEQVALLRDQALLTRDPAVLSEHMDAAAGILEEHTVWLKDNASFLRGLETLTTGQ